MASLSGKNYAKGYSNGQEVMQQSKYKSKILEIFWNNGSCILLAKGYTFGAIFMQQGTGCGVVSTLPFP